MQLLVIFLSLSAAAPCNDVVPILIHGNANIRFASTTYHSATMIYRLSLTIRGIITFYMAPLPVISVQHPRHIVPSPAHSSSIILRS